MIGALLLAAAAASASTGEMIYIDADGCRWVKPVAPPKVVKRPAPAASAASAPVHKARPKKRSIIPPAPGWEKIDNCDEASPPASPPTYFAGPPTGEEQPPDAPFTPVPRDAAPPTFEELAGPPSALVEPPCECFAGSPPVFAPPSYGPPGRVVIIPSGGVPPVPEPSIIYLLAAGVAAIVFVKRRHSDAASRTWNI